MILRPNTLPVITNEAENERKTNQTRLNKNVNINAEFSLNDLCFSDSNSVLNDDRA